MSAQNDSSDTPHDPIAGCAEMVHKSDPDRFLSAMTGDVETRKRLFPLYAFNLEIARAPMMSQEPMVAMIRLQFWRDVIEAAAEGKEAPRHDVATPLSNLVVWGDCRVAPLLRMVEAREGDIHAGPRQTPDEISTYTRETGGALMVAAGQLCGATEFSGDFDLDTALEDVGAAQGLANWFLAVPALAKAGNGFGAPEPEVITLLADQALAQLAGARQTLGTRGNAALRAAWRSEGILRAALARPSAVADGKLTESEFMRRARLMWLSARARW